MVSSITVDGKFTTNITSYSVAEESTPIRAGDNSGGVGSISIEFAEAADSPDLMHKPLRLDDTHSGTTSGVVDELGGDTFQASLSGLSRLSATVVPVKAMPYVGTLGGAIRYYLSLASVSADITIDPTVTLIPVAFIGWEGMLWDRLKDLAVLYGVEMSLVSGYIVIRDIRGRIAENAGDSDISWSLTSSNLASSYTIKNYNLKHEPDTLLYPAKGADIDRLSVISADAGELVELELETGVSLISVQQPLFTQDMPKYYTGPQGLYAVTVKTESGTRILSSDEWMRIGGSLSVEISEEYHSKILIKFRGGTDLSLAPYQLSLIDGGEGATNNYSALAIRGSGVRFEEEDIEIPTGVPPEISADDRGPVVDNIFVANAGMAFEMGLSAGAAFSCPKYTIDVTTSHINRRGEAGTLSYPTYADFAVASGTDTYAKFAIDWAGKTYNDFRDFYYALTSESFENQAFGNVAGSRVRFRDSMFRVRSATIGPEGISYSAEGDTTFAEFSTAWAGGATYASFANQWLGKSYNDFGVKPLWRK